MRKKDNPSSSGKNRTQQRLHLWLIIFLVGLLGTAKVWDHYFNSTDPLDHHFVSNLILVMGTLFSFATSYFIWTLEAGKQFLEREVRRRTETLLLKEKETAAAEARTLEAERRHKEVEAACERLQKTQHQLIQAEKLASVGRVLAGVVHELKTPLVTIAGYGRILEKSDEPEEASRHAAIIRRQAERCLGTVQGLLAFSRDERPVYETVCVQDLLTRTLEELPLEFKQEGIQTFRQCPIEKVVIESDPRQLQKLFTNLLVNSWHALKGVPGRTRQILIHLAASKDSLQLFFTDNGPGIPKEHLDRVFEPFFTTKPAGEGTGLGLSLCYGIVSTLGGKISVQSEEGKGTTFLIELPRTPPSRTAPGREKSARKKRILVVDDERGVTKFLRIAFEMWDYDVLTFGTGKELFDYMEGRDLDADLVILDINLPGMDGFEIARRLRGEDRHALTPILFLTARDIAGDRILADSLAEGFLHKPLDYHGLRESVSRLLHAA